jgi:hypothetical protein
VKKWPSNPRVLMKVKMVVTKSDQLTQRVVSIGFFLNVIGCTAWSKFTSKVPLPVPERTFHWFGCTKKCAIIGFLEWILRNRGLSWAHGALERNLYHAKISLSVFTQNINFGHLRHLVYNTNPRKPIVAHLLVHWNKLYFTGQFSPAGTSDNVAERPKFT